MIDNKYDVIHQFNSQHKQPQQGVCEKDSREIANQTVAFSYYAWSKALFFAMQTPIVASHIGAMPEKIRNNIDGLLFPAGDVQALAHILRDLQQNPQKLAQLRANIQPIYTMAQQVHDIFAVYEEAGLQLPS